MPRDYRETIRALRAKADDKATTPEESATLREKADELEKKYDIKPVGAFTFTVPPYVHGERERYERWKNSHEWEKFNDLVDVEEPQDSGPMSNHRQWNPDAGRFRRNWRPDEQDIISPEYRYDWEDD